MLRRALILALLLALPLAAGKKPKGVPMARLPEQTIDIPSLSLPGAAQPCTNYAWAVAVETMLRAQNVPLDQHYWVQKANGGELCIEPAPNLERLTRALNGNYTLNDGRKVKLETQIILGAPTNPDEAIASLKQGVPLLVFWKSRAYVLRGVIYDEYVYPNGQRLYEVKELRMLDPLAPPKQSEVSFVNGTDDPADIAALVFVTATPISPQPWQTAQPWQTKTKW